MSDTDEGSVCTGHEPCPECGSRDNLARYSDGHAYCFTNDCGYREPADGSSPKGDHAQASRSSKNSSLLQGTIKALDNRRITEETCRKFNYRVGKFNGNTCHIAQYYDPDTRQIVAQGIRLKSKDFPKLGDTTKQAIMLFGQHLWAKGQKRLVITEGEIDCLTVSQLQNNTWPVVSIPCGVKGAKKAIKKNIDYINSFDEVVFMFDMDEPGQEAVAECVPLLHPGKAKIASLPYKDANECLVKGKGKDVVNAIWQAAPYRPDSVVNGVSLKTRVLARVQRGRALPWQGLDDAVMGLRDGELMMFVAGSGAGKTTITAEIEYFFGNTSNLRVGVVRLEDALEIAARRSMGIHLGKRLTINDEGVTDEELSKAYDETIGSGRYVFADHFGSVDYERLFDWMRFMAHAEDVDVLFLDHISLVVSGADLNEDERRLLDNIMTKLKSFAMEIGKPIVVVSHLKRPDKKGHEDGAVTSLAQLRGSAALGQLSDTVIGAERNQQADDPDERNITTIRVLKCRATGFTGPCTRLRYNKDTGRLTEIGLEDSPFSDDEDGEEF